MGSGGTPHYYFPTQIFRPRIISVKVTQTEARFRVFMRFQDFTRFRVFTRFRDSSKRGWQQILAFFRAYIVTIILRDPHCATCTLKLSDFKEINSVIKIRNLRWQWNFLPLRKMKELKLQWRSWNAPYVLSCFTDQIASNHVSTSSVTPVWGA